MVHGTAIALLLLLARAVGPAVGAAGTPRGKLIRRVRLLLESGVFGKQRYTRGLQIRRQKSCGPFFVFFKQLSKTI